MNEIEAGIDEGRHAAGGRLDDHAAGRRRTPVTRADRRRRIDDDRRQAVLDHGLDQPLGGDLALLIGADRLALGERPGLVGRLAVVARLERGDARRVDDALGAGRSRGLHHDSGSVDIGCAGSRQDRAPTADSRRRRGRRNARLPPRREPLARHACRLRRAPRRRPSRLAWSELRLTRARTPKPSASSARATADPTKPVAPVTKARSLFGTDNTPRARPYGARGLAGLAAIHERMICPVFGGVTRPGSRSGSCRKSTSRYSRAP